MGEVIEGNFRRRQPDPSPSILDGEPPTEASMERFREQFAADQASVAHLPAWLQPIELLQRMRSGRTSMLED